MAKRAGLSAGPAAAQTLRIYSSPLGPPDKPGHVLAFEDTRTLGTPGAAGRSCKRINASRVQLTAPERGSADAISTLHASDDSAISICSYKLLPLGLPRHKHAQCTLRRHRQLMQPSWREKYGTRAFTRRPRIFTCPCAASTTSPTHRSYARCRITIVPNRPPLRGSEPRTSALSAAQPCYVTASPTPRSWCGRSVRCGPLRPCWRPPPAARQPPGRVPSPPQP